MQCATFQEQLLNILDNPVEMFHATVQPHSVRVWLHVTFKLCSLKWTWKLKQTKSGSLGINFIEGEE